MTRLLSLFLPNPFKQAMSIFASLESYAKDRADTRLLHQVVAVRQAYTTKALRG